MKNIDARKTLDILEVSTMEAPWYYETWIGDDDAAWLIFRFSREGSREIVEACSESTSEVEVKRLASLLDDDYDVVIPVEFTSYYCPETEEDGEYWEDIGGAGIITQRRQGDALSLQLEAQTASGLAQALLNNPTEADWNIFRIFQLIDSRTFTSLACVLDQHEAPTSTDIPGSRLDDRFLPPTLDVQTLDRGQVSFLLTNLEQRISFAQIYKTLECSPKRLKHHFVQASLAPSGVRLTRTTYSIDELLSNLVPYLQGLRDQGTLVYELLSWFYVAGLITSYNPAKSSPTS